MRMGTDEDTRFILCDLDDGTVRVCRGLRDAESTIEAPDIEGWRVFDGEFFIREVKAGRQRASERRQRARRRSKACEPTFKR